MVCVRLPIIVVCMVVLSAYYYSISEQRTALVSNNFALLKSLLGNNQTKMWNPESLDSKKIATRVNYGKVLQHSHISTKRQENRNIIYLNTHTNTINLFSFHSEPNHTVTRQMDDQPFNRIHLFQLCLGTNLVSDPSAAAVPRNLPDNLFQLLASPAFLTARFIVDQQLLIDFTIYVFCRVIFGFIVAGIATAKAIRRPQKTVRFL